MSAPRSNRTPRSPRAEPTPPADTTTRGDATREGLIRAAIDSFGRDGFSAASTRAISEAAGVNQALIGYHFGGKPRLYLAVLEYIADSVVARIGPLLATIEAELDAAAGPTAERAITLLHGFTDAFAGMLMSEESRSWARLILREQQDPSEGFEVLYAGVMRRIIGVMTRLVARACGGDAAADDCKLTALMIVGQVLIFRSGREAVLREMGWRRVSDAELEAVKVKLRQHVTAILKAES